MKIKQLSVFMENRVGIINEVTSILGAAGVSMRAFSVAESSEFGILRILVTDAERAEAVLAEAGFKVNYTDVLCLKVPHVAGGLSAVLDLLAAESVFIQYMYAFSEGEVASVVIRPNDIDKCVDVLQSSRDVLAAKSSLYSY